MCAALAAELHRRGHDVRVLLPHYASIDTGDLEITPVEFLQRVPIELGAHRYEYGIDTVRLPGSPLMVYLLRCPALYDRPEIYTNEADEHRRFLLLSRAALEMCQRMSFAPDIAHCHDWHVAMIPLYLRTIYEWDRLFADTRTVLTIHNIGYQGVFGAGILPDTGLAGSESLLHQDDLSAGRINFLKTGLLYADRLTTVSPTYAREIQTAEYGMGLEGVLAQRTDVLSGILNGIDDEVWNPETDPLIPHNYTRDRLASKKKNKVKLMKELALGYDESLPLIGMVTRLTFQKGIDLLQQVLPGLMDRRLFSLAVLGSGEGRYEQFFTWLQNTYRDRVCFYRGFSDELAHWIEAASDMFLMPSRYEPCGLNQMYSQRYGSVPIVRETGGLADSVTLVDPDAGSGTGILFRDYNAEGLGWALGAALDLHRDAKLWRGIVRNGMAEDFSWRRRIIEYEDLYAELAGESGAAAATESSG